MQTEHKCKSKSLSGEEVTTAVTTTAARFDPEDAEATEITNAELNEHG